MENVDYISQFLGRRVVVTLVKDDSVHEEELMGVLRNNPNGSIKGQEYVIQTDSGNIMAIVTNRVTDITPFIDVEHNSDSNDPVNHPAHYTSGKYEVIEVIKDKLTPEQFEGYCIGNVMKYIMRYQNKNGLEDLQKGMWYLNYLIEYKKNLEE